MGEAFPGSVPKPPPPPPPRKGRGGGKARGHAPFEQVLDGARRGAEPRTGRRKEAESRPIKRARMRGTCDDVGGNLESVNGVWS